jgi:hypothetical protein
MAKKIVAPDGRIILIQRISARNDRRSPIRFRGAHDAVGIEAPFARPKRNVSATRALDGLIANDENVAGKNRRKHARATRDKPKLAGRAQNLCRQFQLDGLSAWGCLFHGSL